MPFAFPFRKSVFSAGLAGLIVAASTLMAMAESVAKQPHQVPGYYRLNINELEVTALYDGYVHLDPEWLKGISKENVQSLLTEMYVNTDEGIQTAVNGYLINTGNNLVLVDTGAAQCFGPTMGSLRKNLITSGYELSQVDTVLLTHLHPDHSCGLVSTDGTPAFPNATVYVPQTEAEFWLDKEIGNLAEADQTFFSMARAAVAPYVGEKLRRYKPDEELLPGVKSVPAYGHTPGHTAYLFSSKAENLMVWGDIVHNHTVQFAHPEVVIEADVDTDQARASRMKILASTSAEKLWVAGAHLPFPGLGHVHSRNNVYSWVPVEYSPIIDSLKSPTQ